LAAAVVAIAAARAAGAWHLQLRFQASSTVSP
jgi:hypothetical protein